MVDKKDIGLVCQLKNEYVSENDLYIDATIKKMTENLLGESVAEKHLQKPQVYAYIGEDYYLKFEKIFLWQLEELARKKGGKKMDATEFDEIFREELPEKRPSTFMPPSLTQITRAIGKAKRRIASGQWIRKQGIQNSNPIAFVETNKKKLGKHKSWFSDEVINAWNDECKAMQGLPWTNDGKVLKNAIELTMSDTKKSKRVKYPKVSSKINLCPYGKVVKFLKRDVCELDNFDDVKTMIYTQDPNKKISITATYTDGTKVYINPDTLNRFIEEMNPKRSCSESVCEYEV